MKAHCRADCITAELEATYFVNNRAMVGYIQIHSFNEILLHNHSKLEICKLCHNQKDIYDMISSG